MIGEKVKIELAARLIGAPDRRLQNRKWAKTDAMTSAFAHYHREIIHFKRLQNFRKCIFLFKALYLFKIHEQTPFFEQKVWLFGKCSLNL